MGEPVSASAYMDTIENLTATIQKLELALAESRQELARNEYYNAMRSREIARSDIPEKLREFVAALLNQRDGYWEDNRRLIRQLAAKWLPFTPETTLEIGKRYLLYADSNQSNSPFEDGAIDIIRWKERGAYLIQGWTHFHPVNPPSA